MGDFWDDIKKKNEERRIAGIKSDIRALEEQIKEYEDAKKKVESAKKKCNSECEEWKEKLGELKGKEIKQTGISLFSWILCKLKWQMHWKII